MNRPIEPADAVVAILMVVGSRFLGGLLWVPAVTGIGPALYFIGVAAVNRSAFVNTRNAALRWAALVGALSVTVTFFRERPG